MHSFSRSRTDAGSGGESADVKLQTSRKIIRVLGGWVSAALGVLLDGPLCPFTEYLEVRYSSSLEHSAVVLQFGISEKDCDTLWMMFATHCQAPALHLRHYALHPRSLGMIISTFVAWTVPRSSRIAFASLALVEAVFVAQLKGVREQWRFYDFVEFAAVFGAQTHEMMANYLVETFVGDMNAQGIKLLVLFIFLY